MSNLFYDHYISLTRIERHIKNATESSEEREELWRIVDEIVHHRVMNFTLEILDNDHHQHFLEKFADAPHDETLIYFFNEKTGKNFSSIMEAEMQNLEDEIIQLLLEDK